MAHFPLQNRGFCAECWATPLILMIPWVSSDHHAVLSWLVEWMMIWGWFQHSNDRNLTHLIAADIPDHQWTCAITNLCGVHQFSTLLLYFSQWANLAAALQAFCMEYYLWSSHWLKLLGWLEAWNPLFSPSVLLFCWMQKSHLHILIPQVSGIQRVVYVPRQKMPVSHCCGWLEPAFSSDDAVVTAAPPVNIWNKIGISLSKGQQWWR